MAEDPVCRMTVDPAHAAGNTEHAGRTYYFCNPGCLARFKADPARYLAPAPAVEDAAPGTWTCPMHPEIVTDRPGTCPICGMALERREVTATEEANPELADMTRRLWVAVALTAPLFLLAMAEMIPGAAGLLVGRERARSFIELLLASP